MIYKGIKKFLWGAIEWKIKEAKKSSCIGECKKEGTVVASMKYCVYTRSLLNALHLYVLVTLVMYRKLLNISVCWNVLWILFFLPLFSINVNPLCLTSLKIHSWNRLKNAYWMFNGYLAMNLLLMLFFWHPEI